MSATTSAVPSGRAPAERDTSTSTASFITLSTLMETGALGAAAASLSAATVRSRPPGKPTAPSTTISGV